MKIGGRQESNPTNSIWDIYKEEDRLLNCIPNDMVIKPSIYQSPIPEIPERCIQLMHSDCQKYLKRWHQNWKIILDQLPNVRLAAVGEILRLTLIRFPGSPEFQKIAQSSQAKYGPMVHQALTVGSDESSSGETITLIEAQDRDFSSLIPAQLNHAFYKYLKKQVVFSKSTREYLAGLGSQIHHEHFYHFKSTILEACLHPQSFDSQMKDLGIDKSCSPFYLIHLIRCFDLLTSKLYELKIKASQVQDPLNPLRAYAVHAHVQFSQGMQQYFHKLRLVATEKPNKIHELSKRQKKIFTTPQPPLSINLSGESSQYLTTTSSEAHQVSYDRPGWTGTIYLLKQPNILPLSSGCDPLDQSGNHKNLIQHYRILGERAIIAPSLPLTFLKGGLPKYTAFIPDECRLSHLKLITYGKGLITLRPSIQKFSIICPGIRDKALSMNFKRLIDISPPSLFTELIIDLMQDTLWESDRKRMEKYIPLPNQNDEESIYSWLMKNGVPSSIEKVILWRIENDKKDSPEDPDVKKAYAELPSLLEKICEPYCSTFIPTSCYQELADQSRHFSHTDDASDDLQKIIKNITCKIASCISENNTQARALLRALEPQLSLGNTISNLLVLPDTPPASSQETLIQSFYQQLELTGEEDLSPIIKRWAASILPRIHCDKSQNGCSVSGEHTSEQHVCMETFCRSLSHSLQELEERESSKTSESDLVRAMTRAYVSSNPLYQKNWEIIQEREQNGLILPVLLYEDFQIPKDKITELISSINKMASLEDGWVYTSYFFQENLGKHMASLQIPCLIPTPSNIFHLFGHIIDHCAYSSFTTRDRLHLTIDLMDPDYQEKLIKPGQAHHFLKMRNRHIGLPPCSALIYETLDLTRDCQDFSMASASSYWEQRGFLSAGHTLKHVQQTTPSPHQNPSMRIQELFALPPVQVELSDHPLTRYIPPIYDFTRQDHLTICLDYKDKDGPSWILEFIQEIKDADQNSSPFEKRVGSPACTFQGDDYFLVSCDLETLDKMKKFVLKNAFVFGEKSPTAPSNKLGDDPRSIRDRSNIWKVDRRKGAIIKGKKSKNIVTRFRNLFQGSAPIRTPVHLRPLEGYMGAVDSYRLLVNQFRGPELMRDTRTAALAEKYEEIFNQAKPYQCPRVYRGALFPKSAMSGIIPGTILRERSLLSTTYSASYAGLYSRRRAYKDGLFYTDNRGTKDKAIKDQAVRNYLKDEVVGKKDLTFYVIEHNGQGYCTAEMNKNPQEREVIIRQGTFFSVIGKGVVQEKKLFIDRDSDVPAMMRYIIFWLKVIPPEEVGSAVYRDMMGQFEGEMVKQAAAHGHTL